MACPIVLPIGEPLAAVVSTVPAPLVFAFTHALAVAEVRVAFASTVATPSS